MKKLLAALVALLVCGDAYAACPAGSTCQTFAAFASGVSSATALGSSDLFPCIQSAATVSCTPVQISAYVQSALGLGTFATQNYATPPIIGGTTPAAGHFSALSATGAVSGAGFTSYFASPPAIGGTAPAAGSFTTLSATGDLTTDVTGSTQCLHASTSGVVSGTGADCGSGGSSAFNSLTGGTNTTAAMLVGTGASLAPAGTGTITGSAVNLTVTGNGGVTETGTLGFGYVSGGTGAAPAWSGIEIWATDINPSNSGATNDTNMAAHITTCVAAGGCRIHVGCYAASIPLANSAGPAVLLGVEDTTGDGGADTPYNGIWIDGCGYQLNTNQTPTGGTIFQGTSHTYPLFAYNYVAATADYSGPTTFSESWLTVRLTHFAVETCNICIQIGNLGKAGIGNGSILEDLALYDWTGWGLWLENYNLSDVEKIYGTNAQANYTGLAWFGSSIPHTIYNDGNAGFRRVFFQNLAGCTTFPGACQGVVFRQRNSAGGVYGYLNDLNVYDLQVNTGSGIKESQESGFITGSPIIAVTNSGQFPVDMPVFPCTSTTVNVNCNGIVSSAQISTLFVVANTTAVTIGTVNSGTSVTLSSNWTGPTAATYTLTNNGNTATGVTLTNGSEAATWSASTTFTAAAATVGNIVELATTLGGTAVNSSVTSATDFILTWGYHGLEVSGYAGSNAVQPSNFEGLDLEPGGTTVLVLQNAGVHAEIQAICQGAGAQWASTSGCSTSLTARSAYGFIQSTNSLLVDYDAGSAGSSGLVNAFTLNTAATAPVTQNKALVLQTPQGPTYAPTNGSYAATATVSGCGSSTAITSYQTAAGWSGGFTCGTGATPATVTITFGTAAPHSNYICNADDKTSSVHLVNTGSPSTTQCIVTGNITSADVIVLSAAPN